MRKNNNIIHSIKIELILPSEYENFEDIFSKKKYETVPGNTRITYIINLEKGTESLFKPIYSLLKKELRILRDYLTEKETIGWIRRSKSPTEAPILFIPKSDNSLRLYIDYRALNKVTTKNRHPLPLINKLINRLSGAKIYKSSIFGIHITKSVLRKETNEKLRFARVTNSGNI